MLTITLIGVLSSLATELVTYVNAKLKGTVLQGNGSFLLAFAVAFVGAFAKTYYDHGFQVVDLHSLVAYFGQVFTVSQVFFVLVYQKLGLDMSSAQNEAVRYDQSLATG